MSNGIKISQLEIGGSIAQEDYLPVARGSDETYRIAAKQFVVNASTQGSGSSIVIGKEDGAGQTLLFRSLSGTGGVSVVNVGNTSVVSGSITATGTLSARTLEGRFSDNINVKDFGVVGDGVTDGAKNPDG